MVNEDPYKWLQLVWDWGVVVVVETLPYQLVYEKVENRFFTDDTQSSLYTGTSMVHQKQI